MIGTDAPGLADEGLRTRKQRLTREAIHRAAVRNALLAGPDAATVADISAEADVSPRTFFNYFSSKEDAMIGFSGDLPADEDLAAFAERDGDLLDDVVGLIRDVFSGVQSGGDLLADRRMLLARHPQLMQRQLTRVASVEQRILPVVLDRMAASGRAGSLRDPEAAARMLVLLAGDVLRFAIRESARRPDDGVPDVDLALTESIRTLREVLQNF